MCVETPDPLVRFGMMEAVETCGHVFFGHTAPLAAELSRRTGAALRYFGPFHLALETGSLIDADDLFESRRGSPRCGGGARSRWLRRCSRCSR